MFSVGVIFLLAYPLKMSSVSPYVEEIFMANEHYEADSGKTMLPVSGKYMLSIKEAFQMVVDDEVLHKNPFGFEMATVIVNDSVTREAVSQDRMRKFLKFIHDDNVYCKYYGGVCSLFRTGMRIFNFCGLTLKDIDLEKRIINIDHQLLRTSEMIKK